MADSMSTVESITVSADSAVSPTPDTLTQLDNQQVELSFYPELQQLLYDHPWAYEAYANLAEHHLDTWLHSLRVAFMAYELAKENPSLFADAPNAEEVIKAIGVAGLLHDLGKIDYDVALLDKTGGLTDDEFEQLKKHPRKSFEMIRERGNNAQDGAFAELVARIAVAHHEFVDVSRPKYPRAWNESSEMELRRNNPAWLVEAQRILACADQTDTQMSLRYSGSKPPKSSIDTYNDLVGAKDGQNRIIFSPQLAQRAVELRTTIH